MVGSSNDAISKQFQAPDLRVTLVFFPILSFPCLVHCLNVLEVLGTKVFFFAGTTISIPPSAALFKVDDEAEDWAEPASYSRWCLFQCSTGRRINFRLLGPAWMSAAFGNMVPHNSMSFDFDGSFSINRSHLA